jgi:hypothetical protein
LQTFTDEEAAELPSHVGPPAANVEVKLTSVDDDAIEKGADPVGEVCGINLSSKQMFMTLYRFLSVGLR